MLYIARLTLLLEMTGTGPFEIDVLLIIPTQRSLANMHDYVMASGYYVLLIPMRQTVRLQRSYLHLYRVHIHSTNPEAVVSLPW